MNKAELEILYNIGKKLDFLMEGQQDALRRDISRMKREIKLIEIMDNITCKIIGKDIAVTNERG